MKFSFDVNHWVDFKKDDDGDLTLWFAESNGNMIELTFKNNWTSKRWLKDMLKALNKEGEKHER